MVPRNDPTVVSDLRLDRLLFREVAYPQDFQMPAHEHDVDCFVLMLEGAMSGEIVKDRYSAKASNVAFMPAWLPHTSQFHGFVRTFDIVLSANFHSSYGDFIPRDSHSDIGRSAQVRALVTRMYAEFRNPDLATPIILEGLTLETLGHMNRRYEPAVQAPSWLKNALQYLRDDPREARSLRRVAEEVAVHPAHLSRTFRRHVGCTVGEFSRRLRLDQACVNLLEEERSLTSIAHQAGFMDLSHFNRAFKQHTGRTPAQYRASLIRNSCP